MNASTAGTKRRWAWATAGSVVIAGGLAVLFSLSVSRPPSSVLVVPKAKPVIELAERREKSALDDEATLFDPTPLFQPTRWNTAQLKVEAPELGGSFQSYREPAKLSFTDTDLKLGRPDRGESAVAAIPSKAKSSLDLPNPVMVPKNVPDTLAEELPGAIAIGFGRVDNPAPVLPSYGSTVQIIEVGSGRVAVSPQQMAQIRSLAAEARPPGNQPWQPMEFYAAVNPAGLAAPLTIATRSGVEEVDAYFQNFLARTVRVGERLAPGFYRISVGP